VGVQEAHPNARYAVIPEPCRRALGVAQVERGEHLALKVESLGDLLHQVQWHDALGLHPEVAVSVAVRDGLTGDLEDVSEAEGDGADHPAFFAVGGAHVHPLAAAGDVAASDRFDDLLLGQRRDAVASHWLIAQYGANTARVADDDAFAGRLWLGRRRRRGCDK